MGPVFGCHSSRCVWCQGSPLVPVKSQQPSLAAAQHSSALKELKHALYSHTHTHKCIYMHTLTDTQKLVTKLVTKSKTKSV